MPRPPTDRPINQPTNQRGNWGRNSQNLVNFGRHQCTKVALRRHALKHPQFPDTGASGGPPEGTHVFRHMKNELLIPEIRFWSELPLLLLTRGPSTPNLCAALFLNQSIWIDQVSRVTFLSRPFLRSNDNHAFSFLVYFTKWCGPILPGPPHQINIQFSIWHQSCFYPAWGWDRKDMPKRRIIATILRRVITQNSYWDADKSLARPTSWCIFLWWEYFVWCQFCYIFKWY